jgi:hypothetical protein
MTSLALSEALRNEIRTTLEANGQPFSVNVARRVYDIAIAARDLLITTTETVKEAIEQVEDTNGPMDTLSTPGAPTPVLTVAESYGARMFRELMTMVSSGTTRPQDPLKLVHAIAEARRAGMTDVAKSLEEKLVGHALDGDRPILPEPEETYEQGYEDGRDGHVAASNAEQYMMGYRAGDRVRHPAPRYGDPVYCEACKKDPDPRGGSACYDCREIAAGRRPSNGATP